jgi:hypothetical protein
MLRSGEVGSLRLRLNLCRKKAAPCTLIFDEMESLAPRRGFGGTARLALNHTGNARFATVARNLHRAI